MSRTLRKIVLCFFAAVLLSPAVQIFALAEENGDYKLAALTFDDGPGKYTEKLLDAFKERGVKSTFFVVGKNAEKYPELLERMSREGHQLGNHSYSHKYLTAMSSSKMTEEIEKCSSYLETASGGDTGFYIRPTYGAFNAALKSVADAPLITWSVDPYDWKYHKADTIVKNIMSSVRDGDIILLHDIHSASVDAAITVTDKLLEQGYELVTVSELLRRRGIAPENGAVYTCARNTGVNIGPLPDPEEFDESLIESHPAYEAICYTRYTGLFSGKQGDAFFPNKYLSRGMFVTILGRFSGADNQAAGGETGYDDVDPDMYYAPYIKWAAGSLVISDREDRLFMPDEAITHEQFADWLAQYLGSTAAGAQNLQESSPPPEIAFQSYELSELYSKLGLNADGTGVLYDPQSFVTRGYCAFAFMQLSKHLNPEEYERVTAELKGETVPAAEPEPEPAKTEPPPTPIAEDDRNADESISSINKVRVSNLSFSDCITVMTCIIAATALFLYDSKKRA